LTNTYRTDDIPRAGLTIVANVAIATGPAVYCNKIYLLY